MMPKVFTLEPCKNDITSADEYGDIVFLYPPGSKRVAIWHDDFVLNVIECLEKKGFNRDKDFFLVVGHQAPMTMIVAAMVARFGHFNALLFDIRDRGYFEKRLGT